MDSKQTLSIEEVSAQLGTSTSSLRRLCNQGLVPHVRRDHRGHRIFEAWQVNLIDILLKMKQSGFTKSEIKRYAKLFRQGSSGDVQRLAILTTRKHQLRSEIKNRQAAIDFIERQEELHHLLEDHRAAD